MAQQASRKDTIKEQTIFMEDGLKLALIVRLFGSYIITLNFLNFYKPRDVGLLGTFIHRL